jgi:hypothetical protein
MRVGGARAGPAGRGTRPTHVGRDISVGAWGTAADTHGTAEEELNRRY